MFFETIRMALESLRTNKLRSALTLLGMVIGVFSVIASVTAVQVIDDYFTDAFAGIGSTTFFVQKYPAINFGPTDESIRNRQDITYPQYEELLRRARLPASLGPDETFEWATKVSYTGPNGTIETAPNLQLRGVNEEWAINNGYDLDDGRFLSSDDIRYGRPVIVISRPVADELFEFEQPIGKMIAVQGQRFQIVGLLAEKGAILGDNQDNRLLAPITTLFDAFGGLTTRNISIDVRAPSVQMLYATIDEVVGHMRAIRRVPPQNENDFEVVTNDALSGPFESFTNGLTLGGVFIGMIALLAAGIGVMNIMLVSVTERTREIGIRKSLGAKRGTILTQFLLEAVFLCQIGGLVGIGLGVLGGNAMSLLGESLTPTFPWMWAFIAVLGVTIVALAFGVFPAYKAARLNPIEALRYE
ncbi:MAG: ABC transporter permease [Bacteroidota bacterium]